LNVAAHPHCVDASREETLAIAEGYASQGVTEIVALRGDPPKGSEGFRRIPRGSRRPSS
jgi:methylenetetrahydrofolate reductase (NADPH)